MSTFTLMNLLFMYIGITFNVAGVLSIGIAASFGVDTAIVGYIFSLFTVGYSLAILGNGYLLGRVRLKTLMYIAFILTFLGVFAAVNAGSIFGFTCGIFIAGIGMGSLCSSGNYYIVQCCRGQERTARLNILNFFYSFGAIVSPAAAGRLLQMGFSWQYVYIISLAFLIALVIAGTRTEMSSRGYLSDHVAQGSSPWGLKIYLIAAALFFYVVSEMIFTYWIVVYLVESRQLPIDISSTALSLFWVFMAAGRLLTGMAADRFNVEYYMISGAVASFLIFGGMMIIQNPYWVMGLIALMGLSYSGLYASILSYGTLQERPASAGLTTFFVSVGSAGGILSFLISSYLKQYYGVSASLVLSAVAIGMVGVFVGLAVKSGRQHNI